MKRIVLLGFYLFYGISVFGQNDQSFDAHQLIDSLRLNVTEMTLIELEEACIELQESYDQNQDTVSLCWQVFLLSRKLAKTGNSDLAFSELEKVKSISLEFSDVVLESAYWHTLASVMYMHMEVIIEKDEAYREADVLNDSIQRYIKRSLIPEVLKKDPMLYARGLIFQALSQRWVEEEELALLSINEADALIRKHEIDIYRIPVLNIRAMILSDLTRVDEAIELYEYAIEQAENQNNLAALEALTYNYAGTLFNLDKDQEALEMFLVSYDLSLKAETSADNLFATAKSIKECYYFLGDYEKALEWAEKSHEYHQEMESAELRLRFEKMQIEAANFENERLAFQHAQERFKAEEETEKQKRTKLIIGAIGILLLMLLGALYWFSQIKARNKLLQHEKKVSELIRKQEISSMEAMISGQEGERKRLGRELHDHIGSMLSTLGMHFSSAFEKATGKEVSEVSEAKRVIELLDDTIIETRKLSHDMMTGVLNKFGLVSALRDLCDQISETGKVNVRLNSIGMEERLEAMQELNLYRISQELVSNALKHANPQTIRINLVRKKESIVLQVKDDGVGMSQSDFENGNGAGLMNISGRVVALHGKLEFVETQGIGTLIRIIVPLLSEK